MIAKAAGVAAALALPLAVGVSASADAGAFVAGSVKFQTGIGPAHFTFAAHETPQGPQGHATVDIDPSLIPGYSDLRGSVVCLSVRGNQAAFTVELDTPQNGSTHLLVAVEHNGQHLPEGAYAALYPYPVDCANFLPVVFGEFAVDGNVVVRS